MPNNASLKSQLSELGSNSSSKKLERLKIPCPGVLYFLSFIAIASKSKSVKKLAEIRCIYWHDCRHILLLC